MSEIANRVLSRPMRVSVGSADWEQAEVATEAFQKKEPITQPMRVSVGDSGWKEAKIAVELVEARSMAKLKVAIITIALLLAVITVVSVVVYACVTGDHASLAQVWELSKDLLIWLVGWAVGQRRAREKK